MSLLDPSFGSLFAEVSPVVVDLSRSLPPKSLALSPVVVLSVEPSKLSLEVRKR